MSEAEATHCGLADRLKAETAELHAVAEGTSFQRAMGRGEISRSQYTRYLHELRSIHHTIELLAPDALRSTPALAPFVRGELSKVGLIDEDLRCLADGTSSAELLPATRRLAEAIRQAVEKQPIRLIGPIYVLEGSTNGGRFMAVSLQHSLGLVPPNGLRYMDPYGTAQRTMWMRFRADLDGAQLPTAQQDAVVDAAKVMFRGITDVLDALWEEFATLSSAPRTVPVRS